MLYEPACVIYTFNISAHNFMGSGTDLTLLNMVLFYLRHNLRNIFFLGALKHDVPFKI